MIIKKKELALFLREVVGMIGHMNIFSDRLAIDPGSDRTLLYSAKRGIVMGCPAPM
ncbi:MAG: hypothetical protein PVI13_00780 [Desulfobacterales bacterium]|jgi:hypothetical protein